MNLLNGTTKGIRMEVEKIKEIYYTHLCNKIINMIELNRDYECIDYEEVKLELLRDLKTMFEDKEAFESLADALRIGRSEKMKLERRLKGNNERI